MRQDRLLILLEKYKNNELLPAEWSELMEAVVKDQELENLVQQDLLARMGNEDPVSESALGKALERVLAIDKPISSVIRPVHRAHFLRRWGWVAASVILLLGIGAYLRTSHQKNTGSAAVAAKAANVAPGKEGAILTLADGSQVVLDSLGNGVIANQNGSEVVLKNGRLTYDPTGKAAGNAEYNTISTPKGRQFQVILPDGTKIWLNSASSIRYPTVFNGSERRVEIIGEAYFEVSKNEKLPFRLNVNHKAEVEVLGTHFNINAYENEAAISTTLLEGSVKVAAFQMAPADRPVILKPGQQAQIAKGQPGRQTQPGIKVIDNADIGKAMAWKNGLFNFEGASLEEVMKQLERWYDIEVVYKNKVPDIRFEGEMTRDVSLNGLLNALKRSDVNFRIEGRKLIVLP